MDSRKKNLDRISILEDESNILDQIEQKSTTSTSCFSIFYAVAIGIPIVVMLSFYALKPWFVMKKNDDGTESVCFKKVLKWSLLFVALIGIGYYLYSSGIADGLLCSFTSKTC